MAGEVPAVRADAGAAAARSGELSCAGVIAVVEVVVGVAEALVTGCALSFAVAAGVASDDGAACVAVGFDDAASAIDAIGSVPDPCAASVATLTGASGVVAVVEAVVVGATKAVVTGSALSFAVAAGADGVAIGAAATVATGCAARSFDHAAASPTAPDDCPAASSGRSRLAAAAPLTGGTTTRLAYDTIRGSAKASDEPFAAACPSLPAAALPSVACTISDA